MPSLIKPQVSDNRNKHPRSSGHVPWVPGKVPGQARAGVSDLGPKVLGPLPRLQGAGQLWTSMGKTMEKTYVDLVILMMLSCSSQNRYEDMWDEMIWYDHIVVFSRTFSHPWICIWTLQELAIFFGEPVGNLNCPTDELSFKNFGQSLDENDMKNVNNENTTTLYKATDVIINVIYCV